MNMVLKSGPPKQHIVGLGTGIAILCAVAAVFVISIDDPSRNARAPIGSFAVGAAAVRAAAFLGGAADDLAFARNPGHRIERPPPHPFLHGIAVPHHAAVRREGEAVGAGQAAFDEFNAGLRHPPQRAKRAHFRQRNIVHGADPEGPVRSDPSVIEPHGQAFRGGDAGELALSARLRVKQQNIHAAGDNQLTALAEPEAADCRRKHCAGPSAPLSR